MYKKIMVPLDGSTLAECVLPHVKALAEACKVEELILTRVVEAESIYKAGDSAIDPNIAAVWESERKKTAGMYLEGIARQLELAGLPCKAKTIVGRVAESLVDQGVKDNVDLIIIATHGRSGVTRWVRGSVADKILRSSRLPVMMIRAPGTEHGV